MVVDRWFASLDLNYVHGKTNKLKTNYEQKLLIVFILCTRLAFLYSQDAVYILHATLGDTIDKKEKINFDLFPELKNFDFKFGIIYSYGETKKLKAYTQNDSVIVKQLDSSIISEYQSNIDKLLNLYSTQNHKDTTTELNKKIILYDSKNNNSNINNSLNIDKAALEKSAYEGRRQRNLRSTALERGLSGQKVIDAQNYGSYGEIKFKKKK